MAASNPHLKILVVGPCEAGKSHLVNLLSGGDQNQQQPATSIRGPTVGVRILEYDANTGGYDDVVELWDCSGRQNYERCFPALRKDTVGVVYVYNPENPVQVEALEYWYDHFSPRTLGLNPNALMIVQYLKSNQVRDYVVPNKIAFASIQQPLVVTWDDVGRKIKPAFDKYLTKVFKTVQERQQQEEEYIMKM